MQSLTKRQTAQLTIWVRPAVKHEMQRIAQAAGLTTSRTGAAALEEWLARRIHVEHAGILQPIIEQSIAKGMRAYSSRIATLLVRDLFVNEQTRAIAYNNLRTRPGITLTNEAIDKIMDGSKNTAKRNIARVDPELIPVIGAIETWLEQGVSAAHD